MCIASRTLKGFHLIAKSTTSTSETIFFDNSLRHTPEIVFVTQSARRTISFMFSPQSKGKEEHSEKQSCIVQHLKNEAPQ
jgi:hypothetical protein